MRKFIDGRKVGCVVPMHKEVATGTLHSILKQASIDPQEFLNNV